MAKEKEEKSSLKDRIKANSTIKETALITESKILKNLEFVQTPIPIFNIALSGDVDGGFSSGLTQFAGPSKHFKTLFSLILAKTYMDKYPDSFLLLYISEFGQPIAYFDALHMDKSRIILAPIVDVEQLKSELMNQIEKFERGDKVFIMIDSIGNLASRKETEDALKDHAVADMTRAKALKSLFRMIGIRLTLKDIPMVIVNHTYQTLEIFSKQVVGGGTGTVYNSDNIFLVGRQKEEEGDEHSGYNFTLTVEKSRFVKERSKFDVTVTFDKGVNRWSGLLEEAVDLKFVEKLKTKPITYRIPNYEETFTEKATNTEVFWERIITKPEFKEAIRKKYQLASNELLEA